MIKFYKNRITIDELEYPVQYFSPDGKSIQVIILNKFDCDFTLNPIDGYYPDCYKVAKKIGCIK